MNLEFVFDGNTVVLFEPYVYALLAVDAILQEEWICSSQNTQQKLSSSTQTIWNAWNSFLWRIAFLFSSFEFRFVCFWVCCFVYSFCYILTLLWMKLKRIKNKRIHIRTNWTTNIRRTKILWNLYYRTNFTKLLSFELKCICLNIESFILKIQYRQLFSDTIVAKYKRKHLIWNIFISFEAFSIFISTSTGDGNEDNQLKYIDSIGQLTLSKIDWFMKIDTFKKLAKVRMFFVTIRANLPNEFNYLKKFVIIYKKKYGGVTALS